VSSIAVVPAVSIVIDWKGNAVTLCFVSILIVWSLLRMEWCLESLRYQISLRLFEDSVFVICIARIKLCVCADDDVLFCCDFYRRFRPYNMQQVFCDVT